MTAAPPPDFLSVAEAAVILRVSEMTVRRRIDDGDLCAYRIGGKGSRVQIDRRDRIGGKGSRVQIDRRDLYTFLRQSRSGR